MDAELNARQQTTLLDLSDWYRDPERRLEPFKLQGYAGTGKTTTAAHIPHVTGVKVVYAAFTGKAASVLAGKGCFPAMTLHSLLYRPIGQNEDGDVMFSALEPGMSMIDAFDLVVVDEASMVNDRMANDLLAHGKPVVALGDPAQLPPVFGTGALLKGRPDAMLTRVERHEGRVLDLATAIRRDGPAAVRYHAARESSLRAASQIIVPTNRLRRDVIDAMRRGRSAYPEAGDRIIVRANNKDMGVYNGNQFVVEGFIGDPYVPLSYDEPQCGYAQQMYLRGDDGVLYNGPVWHKGFLRDDDARDLDGTSALKAADYSEMRQAIVATYADAITCHVSQGSGWPNVLVVDSSFTRDRAKWLYTAVTRAEEKVMVCREKDVRVVLEGM